MPRRIVLHMGFHKTGTSSVQATLRANRKALKSAVAIRLKGQMKELMSATRGYSTYRDRWSLSKVSRRFDALLEGLPDMPHRTLILSAEELAGHMPGRGELRDYFAAPILAQCYVERAAKAFPQAEVLLYLSTRAPESWLRSAWAEHVKSSSMTLDFADFAAQYQSGSDLDAALAALRAASPCTVHATALEDCRDLPLGPTDPLLDLCDIPLELRHTLVPVAAENLALGPDVTQALLVANRTHTDKTKRSAAKRAILEAFESNTL